MSAASLSYGRGANSAPGTATAAARVIIATGRFGPPLPIKLLAVAGRLLDRAAARLRRARLLGLARLEAQRRPRPLRRSPAALARIRRARAFAHCEWPRRSTGNAVLDERRRETLRAIQEEAEAYADFERRQRESRDREAFDRFMADRKAAEAAKRDEPKAPDAV